MAWEVFYRWLPGPLLSTEWVSVTQVLSPNKRRVVHIVNNEYVNGIEIYTIMKHYCYENYTITSSAMQYYTVHIYSAWYIIVWPQCLVQKQWLHFRIPVYKAMSIGGGRGLSPSERGVSSFLRACSNMAIGFSPSLSSSCCSSLNQKISFSPSFNPSVSPALTPSLASTSTQLSSSSSICPNPSFGPRASIHLNPSF